MTHFTSHFWLSLSQEEFKSSDSHAVTLLIHDPRNSSIIIKTKLLLDVYILWECW